LWARWRPFPDRVQIWSELRRQPVKGVSRAF
jgi:hypothetical protein